MVKNSGNSNFKKYSHFYTNSDQEIYVTIIEKKIIKVSIQRLIPSKAEIESIFIIFFDDSANLSSSFGTQLAKPKTNSKVLLDNLKNKPDKQEDLKNAH